MQLDKGKDGSRRLLFVRANWAYMADLSLRVRVPPAGSVFEPVVLGIALHCEWRWARALHTKD